MTREVSQSAGGPRVGGFKAFSDSQMKLGAAYPGEPIVDRTADQLVREPVDQLALRQLLDDPAADRLVKRAAKLGLGQTGSAPDDVELELRPHGGRQIEQHTGRGRKPGQSLADDLANAFRRPQCRERTR